MTIHLLIQQQHCQKDANKINLEKYFGDYNNRLQLIPPKLIEDTESNPVLNSIGSNKVYQNIDNTKLKVINGLPLQVCRI